MHSDTHPRTVSHSCALSITQPLPFALSICKERSGHDLNEGKGGAGPISPEWRTGVACGSADCSSLTDFSLCHSHATPFLSLSLLFSHSVSSLVIIHPWPFQSCLQQNPVLLKGRTCSYYLCAVWDRKGAREGSSPLFSIGKYLFRAGKYNFHTKSVSVNL